MLTGLARSPVSTMRGSLYNATNMQKGTLAGLVGSEIPNMTSGDAKERGGSVGRALGYGAGMLTFRRGTLMQDLVGGALLGSAGEAAGKTLAGAAG